MQIETRPLHQVAARPSESRRRYFVMTTGRSGSTLLSVILADGGAAFAMDAPQNWDRECGEMEHPMLLSAANWIKRAHDISADKPLHGYRRGLWSALRSIGKRKLRTVLTTAQYVKAEHLDLLVYPAFKLGFSPSIILSYRRFEDYAVSAALRSGHANLATLAEYYNRVYRTGLLQLMTFGGCVVSYDRLVDPQDTSWAGPVAAITGLPARDLIQARNRRVMPPSARVRLPCLDPRAKETYEAVDALSRDVVTPSRQISRHYALRRQAA